MKKKITAILVWILCLIFLVLVTILVIKVHKETQVQLNDVYDRLAELETSNSKLRKKVTKIKKTIDELRSFTNTTQTENATLQESDQSSQIIQGDSIDIADLDAGNIIDISQIAWFNIDQYFQAYEIIEGDKVYNRIIGKSYQVNNNIALSDLRYLKILHYNFNGEVQIGELIVNVKLTDDFISIFKILFENRYEIQSMYLIDNYWTGEGASSDSASIDENNTSAFCYRTSTGGSSLSNHAYGCAIDINSQQNPYVTYDTNGNGICYHENARQYMNRTAGLDHVITHDDLCYQLFIARGFTWGGDWENGIKDFQHFEKSIY